MSATERAGAALEDILGKLDAALGQGVQRVALHGAVEGCDGEAGIEGWAVDLDSPDAALRLELVVGESVIAHCHTALARPDVQLAGLGGRARPGFRFSGRALGPLHDLPAALRGERVAVRVSGTPYLLPAREALPTAEQLAGRLPRTPRATPGPRGVDVKQAIVRLEAEARRLTALPLRPDPKAQLGHIELVAADEDGLFWIGGWVHSLDSLEFPAVIVDKRKFPAGVSLVAYQRDDLPATAHAIIGVMETGWRPGPDTGDVLLYFGANGEHFLKSVSPLRRTSTAEVLTLLENSKARLRMGRPMDLQRLLSSGRSWAPDTARLAGFPVQAALDSVVAIPGFGCFVEGWAVSPLKQVARLALRAGGVVMDSDPVSLCLKPRPDLADGMPQMADALQEAGFVALLRGPVTPEDVSDPVLKITFRDGTSVNQPVNPQVMRVAARAEHAEALSRFYPALAAEPFFAEVGAAIRAQAEASLGPAVAVRVTRAPGAIVLAVPDDLGDGSLVFDQALRHAATLPPEAGLCFVIGRGPARSALVAAFEGLRRAAGRPCSLFVMDDADYAFYGLSGILPEIGADRFGFVGRHVFLTGAGWEEMGALLSQDGLAFPGFDDRVPGEIPGAPSADLFAWSAAPFRAWLASAPFLLGGAQGDNGLAAAADWRSAAPGAALRTRTRRPAGLVMAMNAIALGGSDA
ncbi:MAG TPA: hypothetical protein VE033_02095 [Acetobacteraceae bacterium]|nr:hypothetical protein [Acetobacteraceae bacterium]